MSVDGNPSDSCWDISLKITDVNLTVVLEEKDQWDSSSSGKT